ncbi:MAG: hypothetical protein PHU85_05705 [Phycisphaerae bacterium]|nr:hypothetical protein [Phycisphaerae bacterium]
MRATLIVCIAAVGSVIGTSQGIACPACNLHNMLGDSVRSSKTIVVGKLSKVLGKNNVEITATRVVRGDVKPGQSVKMSGAFTKDLVGLEGIFCDPTSHYPRYDFLPLEAEFEVTWLAQWPMTSGNGGIFESGPTTQEEEAFRPKSISMALKLAQGVSNEARRAGMEYLAAAKHSPTDAVLRAVADGREARTLDSFQFECLMQVLMYRPDPQAKAWVLHDVQTSIATTRPGVEWSKGFDDPTKGGEELAALVGCATETWDWPQWAYYGGPRRNPPKEIMEKRAAELLREVKRTLPESSWTKGTEMFESDSLLIVKQTRDMHENVARRLAELGMPQDRSIRPTTQGDRPDTLVVRVYDVKRFPTSQPAGSVEARARVRDAEVKFLMDALPTLSVAATADVVYALSVTETVSPEKLMARFASAKDNDGLALGLFRAAVWLGIGLNEHADAYCHAAYEAATNPELKAAIRKTIDRRKKWMEEEREATRKSPSTSPTTGLD